MNTTTNNINTARREANCYTKALQIIKEGYTFTKDADSEVIAVCKPGQLAASYWINMISEGCDCPDFQKHGTFCKHTMANDLIEDEAKMWESICAEYDANN